MEKEYFVGIFRGSRKAQTQQRKTREMKGIMGPKILHEKSQKSLTMQQYQMLQNEEMVRINQ